MEKILENDFRNGMLELIDNYIDAYSDMMINAIFCGNATEVSAFVGGCFALRKLRKDVVDGKYNRKDTMDVKEFEKILREVFGDDE